jgi:hypothetical protein
MCAAEFFRQPPNFLDFLAENICWKLATLLTDLFALRFGLAVFSKTQTSSMLAEHKKTKILALPNLIDF